MKISKVSDNAHYYIAGAELYYLLTWIFTWYPAFIIGLFACQCCEPSEDGGPEMVGIIVAIVVYGVIQILIALEKYVPVIIIYLVTLWPFIQQIEMYFYHLDSGPGGTDQCFPLPPVDWVPFF